MFRTGSERNTHLIPLLGQMLQPKYTMHGFEWKDQRGVEGTGFVRALRCLMTSQLPNLLPSLRCTLENEMTAELKQSRAVRGESENVNRERLQGLTQSNQAQPISRCSRQPSELLPKRIVYSSLATSYVGHLVRSHVMMLT